jgi:hypothetical protein
MQIVQGVASHGSLHGLPRARLKGKVNQPRERFGDSDIARALQMSNCSFSRRTLQTKVTENYIMGKDQSSSLRVAYLGPKGSFTHQVR